MVTRNENASAAEYIGKGWINTNSETGEEFIRISLDNDVEDAGLKKGYSLYLNVNEKREGKKDADYRVSIRKDKPVEPSEPAAEAATE